jgi:hypothetical protein
VGKRTSKKATVMPMEEVRRGLIQYEDIAINHVFKTPSAEE